MPIKTEHYDLESFGWGDFYASASDNRRFTTIDNQLAFISDQVDEGIINGWDVTYEDGDLYVSRGMGIIGRRVMQSFGAIQIQIDDNTSRYVYIRAKDNEVAALSGNSSIASVVAEDSVPPNSPEGVVQVTDIQSYLSSLTSYTSEFEIYIRNLLGITNENEDLVMLGYKQLAFSWTANNEADFDYYKIRKFDGSDYNDLGITEETFYADGDLEQNTSYIYQIIAVDLSGNESDPTILSISTDVDSRIPLPPSFIQAYTGNQTMEVVWNHSSSNNVSLYRVVLQLLDADYNVDGSPVSVDVEAETYNVLDSTYTVFEELTNGATYRVTIYSVSDALYLSDGISIEKKMLYLPGAGEISSADIQFELSQFENVGLEADLYWRYDQDDPYLAYAHKFIITFLENGSRDSEPIEVLETFVRSSACTDTNDGQCYLHHIKYLPFRENGLLEYESFKEYTPYTILIQTEDVDGNRSGGFVTRIEKTPVTELVSAITNYSIERKTDNSLFISWTNPTESYFDYNKITITITDLGVDPESPSTYEDTFYANAEKISKRFSYVIPSSEFSLDYRYNVVITPFDVFGTEGNSYTSSIQFQEDEEEVLRPEPPQNLLVTTGDTEVYLQWNLPSEYDDISYFKIYRADYAFYLKADEFLAIATIPATNTSFTDYTVVNGNSYNYFITSVDMYGNESFNPADNYISTFTPPAEPRSFSDMDVVEGLIVIGSSGGNAELSWNASSDGFDGYEILRSNYNNYSFEYIGFAFPSETTYIDRDALLKDGETYYYIVRKYRNGVEAVVSESAVTPSNSILIAQITSRTGSISIDSSLAYNLAGFEDPIRDRTDEKINAHRHIVENGLDKRIELHSNITVLDWTTNDYQVYTTESDLEGADNYIVYVAGIINEDYFSDAQGNVDVVRLRQAQIGESPVSYEIDVDNGEIVFQEPLYSACRGDNCPDTPYSAAPSIGIELVNVSEVSGELPSSRVKSLSADQFETGMFSSEQMPQIHHSGRINERLIPLKLPMQTFDNYLYSLAESYSDEDRNKMGDAVAFYDIVQGPETETLVAATSSGVWFSDNYGREWEQRQTFPSTVHRIYQSDAGDYYAITAQNVYISNGTSFRSWRKMSGLDFVKAIRDIAEDSTGNLYLSTDLGVFRLNSQYVPYIEDTWEKLSIFGPRTSEAYGIIYEDEFIDGSNGVTGRILVSNELGLIQSIDNGRSWSYITELDSFIKIRKFIKTTSNIFALADTAVYRKDLGDGDFSKVMDLDCSYSRRMEIFNDKIYVGTDEGPQGSENLSIYTIIDADSVSVWPLTNIKNNPVPITCLAVIGNDLFIGAEKKLYIFDDNEKMWLQYEQKNTSIPTFYVDNAVQKIGCYYNNEGSSHNVFFDEAISQGSYVEVSNKYDIYFAEYGGWSRDKYDAKLYVYQNGLQFGESEETISISAENFINFSLPSYDDETAHKDIADTYASNVTTDLDSITSLAETSGDTVVTMVRTLFADIDKFLSQIYEQLKTDFVYPAINTQLVTVVSVTSNFGETTTTEVPVYYNTNQTKGTSYTTSINTSDGLFEFGIPFDKYDDMRVDIMGVSTKNAGALLHREIEDAFEDVYSGLPSYLSQVQQVNITKLGIYTEKQWPDMQSIYSPLLQSRNIIPYGNNWYDTLNSTINYKLESSENTDSLSLIYPSAVIYVSETGKVLVGGRGGVLEIDSTTFEIGQVSVSVSSTTMVRDIYRANDYIYIVTDTNIYESQDYGATWSDYTRSGLSNNLYSMGYVGNNLIIGGDDGIYAKSFLVNDWDKSVSSNSPVSTMLSSNVLFAVIDGEIKLSANGYNFVSTGIGPALDILDIVRFGYTNTYVATKQGLYSDNGTFNSDNASLQDIDLGIIWESGVTINCIDTDSVDKTVVGLSNGTYAIIEDNVIKPKENTALQTIHKILIVGNDVWVFGNNMFRVPSFDYPMRLSTGVPI